MQRRLGHALDGMIAVASTSENRACADQRRLRPRHLRMRWCYGKMPITTFIDMLPVARKKIDAACVTQTVFVRSEGPPADQITCALLHVTSHGPYLPWRQFLCPNR